MVIEDAAEQDCSMCELSWCEAQPAAIAIDGCGGGPRSCELHTFSFILDNIA